MQDANPSPPAANSQPAGARYVTIFFSDIVGFSALTDRLGDHAAGSIVDRILAMQSKIISREGAGRVIKFIGDAVFAVFDTPSVAVTRALEIQRALNALRQQGGATPLPQVRIGLHVGEVLLEQGDRLDVVGRHVNRARRVMESADGGQVLVSRGVLDAGRDFIADVPTESLAIRHYGEHYLRGVGAIEICEVADLRMAVPHRPATFEKDHSDTALTGGLEQAGYRTEGRIGEGAFGVVYRATAIETAKPVALKVLSPYLVDDADARARFAKEAEHLTALRLPGLANIIESRIDHRPPFIVMDLVPGQPIDVALGGAHFTRIAAVFRDIALALGRAHDRGIVHCDLKPSNILVTRDHSPVILDFGTSALRSGITPETTISSQGIIGTPTYLAPEQLTTSKVRPQTDIYSLGVVMFKVLTGRLPFLGNSVHDVIQAQLHEDPPLPVSLRRDIPDGLQRICLKAMEKDPARRYKNLSEMVADLERVMRGDVVRTRPSVYENLLYHRTLHHVDQINSWCEQGLLNPEERNRLLSVYEPLLKRGIPAVMEGRLIRFWQTAVYIGGWLAVNGAVLWLVLHWPDLERWARLTLGSLPGVIATVLALFMWRFERFRLEFVALIVVVIATPLLASVWVYEFEVGRSLVPDYNRELFVRSADDSDGLNNFQIMVVTLLTVIVAGAVMIRTGTTTHSAQATLAALAAYSGILVFLGIWPWAEHRRWAGLALRFVPFLLVVLAIIARLISLPNRRHQATPWLYLCALTLGAIFISIALYSPQEWFHVQAHRDLKSYLALSVAGVLLAGCGLLGRKLLAHRGRLPTLGVTLAGLVSTLYALRYAAHEWKRTDWVMAQVAGVAIPPPDIALLLVAIAMTLLASRVQMTSFLVVGLAGTATALHVLGREYFEHDQWWPAAVIATGVSFCAVALAVELRRTRGNALDDLTTRTRL
jgi:serine/threonine protein kinase/class 3 adenylate cyclase